MSMLKANVMLAPSCDADATACSGTDCLVPPSNFNATLSVVLSTVLTIMLAMVMFAMGCTVEAAKLWGHIKRPWGIIIGFLCQFGIMPFTAFALSLAFGVQAVQAVVIIIMGCCPGGSNSNIICYWLDGDMDLSISMTTCSSLLALGMMPLCLLIYTSVWTSSDSIKIPYDSIGITLAALIIPIAVGMYVKRRWPEKAKKILKVGSIAGFALIIIIAVVGGVLYQSSWTIAPSLWIIGTIYPFIGCSLGFFLARFVGQPWYRCRTIALETGFQNAQLCSTIVQLSFSPEELEIMFAFPLIYSIFQLVSALVFVGCKTLTLMTHTWAIFSSIAGLFSVLGFQLYKRRCGGGGGSSANSDAPYLDGHNADVEEQKYCPRENGGFEGDESGNRDVKDKSTGKSTAL